MIAFGPVPSRRLGRSLGINNIPGRKVCSYECVYCQVGKTMVMTNKRVEFYQPEVVYKEVKSHLSKLEEANKPEYLTFVSNGEPTLDIHLGKTIDMLKAFHIPIAVITNASLLSKPKLRKELRLADLVSVKIDVDDEIIWKRINQPYKALKFDEYKEGIMSFAGEFKNRLISETMLIKGLNDSVDLISKTADFVASIHPSTAYLSIPTRPPLVSTVEASDEFEVNVAFQIFKEHIINTELLIGFEGTNTGFTGNALEDILNMCAVHPIREDTMAALLEKDNADRDLLDSLLTNGYIKKISYQANTYYLRKFHI